MQCCESSAEERSAGNPHATFCGNRRRATASGDPVGGSREPPYPDRPMADALPHLAATAWPPATLRSPPSCNCPGPVLKKPARARGRQRTLWSQCGGPDPFPAAYCPRHLKVPQWPQNKAVRASASEEAEGQDSGAEAVAGGADPAAVALALGGASRKRADAFLRKQGRLVDLQSEHLLA